MSYAVYERELALKLFKFLYREHFRIANDVIYLVDSLQTERLKWF